MPGPFPSDRFAGLLEAAATVVEATDLDTVLQRTVETARDVTGARYAALGVIGEHGTLVRFLNVGFDPGTADAIGHPPLGRGLLGTVIQEAKTIRLDRISDHPDSYGFPEHHPPMNSFLGVPIHIGAEVFGNLYLTEKVGGFTETDQVLVESLAVIAGAAVSTARLHGRLRDLAVIEDRERIARDLHDSIIQDLFAIGLTLQGLAARQQDEASRNALDASVDRLDAAIDSLRRLIFGLRRLPRGRDLEAAVSALVAELSGPHNVQVLVSVTVGDEEIQGERLDDVLQFVKEAISNALRHARASLIEVNIEKLNRQLILTVRDDGVGFDPNEMRPGMGLANLKDRARRLGGEMAVMSVPNQGTTVEAVIPSS